MPPGPSVKRSSFFAPASGSSSRLSGGVGGGKAEDADLQRAIALSEAEAKLSAMSEEEMLQRALEASEAEAKVKVGSTSTSEAETGTSYKTIISAKRGAEEDESVTNSQESSTPAAAKKKIKLLANGSLGMEGPTQSVVEEPHFTSESFLEEEHVISKFDGSLDLLSCKGWIRKDKRAKLKEWMLNELAWHRVSYTQIRTKQKIITPRFTATFGKDDTGAPDSAYPVKPKVIPSVLDQLRQELTRKTGARFNAIIINFYQDGKDSISYHADDESFLGPLPTIASISLGSSRDFFLRRKYGQDSKPSTQQFYTKGTGPAATRPTEKMRLDDGDLLVMRGKTQAEWEHSIPKRANAGGRINLTFRRVVSVKGTNNFQRYNRGLPTDDDTKTYRWDARKGVMVPGSGGV